MIKVVKYSSKDKEEWDNFVSNSNCPSFLFYRVYIEYHSDRFEDYSLMVYDEKSLKAIIPGTTNGNHLYSHRGLTFGGLILKSKYHYTDVQLYLNSVNSYLNTEGITELTIKTPPYFYNKNLAQEQSLFLQRNTNIETKTVLGIAINTIGYTFPKRCVRKNKLELYQTSFVTDLSDYWQMLESNLKERHDSKPVHSIEEITKLRYTFPENIKLLSLINNDNGDVEAGALIYLSNTVAKVQYFATTEEGRKNRVSDVLYYSIIDHYKNDCQFIDFGTCEEGDNEINVQLLETKEKFGANSFPIYTFTLNTSSLLAL